MTATAAWATLYFLSGVVGTFIVLWIATRFAWLKATGLELLGFSAVIQLVSLVPKIGWLLVVVAFFMGLTRYFGANGFEATYAFLMFLLVQFAFFLFAFAA
jgi:hypothetical protein